VNGDPEAAGSEFVLFVGLLFHTAKGTNGKGKKLKF
jgi:hypothetical protein